MNYRDPWGNVPWDGSIKSHQNHPIIMKQFWVLFLPLVYKSKLKTA